MEALFAQEEKQLVEDYFTFLRFPSISAEPQHKQDLIDCCNWVRDYLASDFKTEIWETPGYPCVYAEWLGAPGVPTLLLYGHYDVQPVDPLEEWETPPFEPTLKGREVYARGAQDNKGQIIYALCAVRALLRRDGKLPLNVKILIEGEEESKSVGLSKIVPDRAKQLQADYLIAPDFDIPSLDKPGVVLGLRGLVALTIDLRGALHDLHSGMAGGIVYNPNHALIEMLAALRNADGQIQVPGFYDGVADPTEEEREALTLDFDEEVTYKKEFQAAATGGEKGYTPGESNRIRPTLEINGISGGYAGTGFKTVIPARATAKISCRIVPGQDPKKLAAGIEAFLRERCPKGFKMEVTDHGGAEAVRCSPKSPLAAALAATYEEVFGKPCIFTLSGASVPITAQLAKAAGAEPAFLGVGLMDDAIHAPNEHFGLDRQKLGFLTIGQFLQKLGGQT